MEFPRLTSGSVGALTFTHVNEVFSRIEKLEERVHDMGVPFSDRMGTVLLAKVTAISGGRAAWVQVARTSVTASTFEDVNGGITSAIGQDQYARSIDASGLLLNQVLAICLRRSNDGKTVYEPLLPQKIDAPFIITGHDGTGPVWRYFAKDARWDALNQRFYEVAQSQQVTMRNGCENPLDTATEIGVGTIVDNAAPFERRPIKAGTVVIGFKTNDGQLTFSVPNGYRVVC